MHNKFFKQSNKAKKFPLIQFIFCCQVHHQRRLAKVQEMLGSEEEKKRRKQKWVRYQLRRLVSIGWSKITYLITFVHIETKGKRTAAAAAPTTDEWQIS